MVKAQKIREFFATLFGSRRVEDLKEHLAKTEKERDYFRARADRLELMLLSPVRLGLEAPAKRSSAAPSATNSTPVGRKPWPVIQAEWQQEQAEEAAREKKIQDKAAALKVS